MHIVTDAVYFGSPTWLSATYTWVKFFTKIQAVTAFTIGLAEQATITPNGNITTQGAITSTGNLSAPNIYTKTEVDNLLNQKHPLMLTTSNLATTNSLL